MPLGRAGSNSLKFEIRGMIITNQCEKHQPQHEQQPIRCRMSYKGDLHGGVGLPSGAHQWRRGRLSFFFFLPSLFSPPKRGKIRPFLGRLFFFRPFMHAGGCMQRTKRNRVQLKKHRRFQKNCRLRHRTPLTVRSIIRTFTYGTEEV